MAVLAGVGILAARQDFPTKSSRIACSLDWVE
jgi:hypothetical protein